MFPISVLNTGWYSTVALEKIIKQLKILGMVVLEGRGQGKKVK